MSIRPRSHHPDLMHSVLPRQCGDQATLQSECWITPVKQGNSASVEEDHRLGVTPQEAYTTCPGDADTSTLLDLATAKRLAVGSSPRLRGAPTASRSTSSRRVVHSHDIYRGFRRPA